MYNKLLLLIFLPVIFCFSNLYSMKHGRKKTSTAIKIKAVLEIPECGKKLTKTEDLILHPENSTDSLENQAQDLIKQIDAKQKLITGTIAVSLFCPNSNQEQIKYIKETFKAMQAEDKTQATITLKDINGGQDSSAKYKIAAELKISYEKSTDNTELFKKSKHSAKKSKL